MAKWSLLGIAAFRAPLLQRSHELGVAYEMKKSVRASHATLSCDAKPTSPYIYRLV
jgi:hypothetical protein